MDKEGRRGGNIIGGQLNDILLYLSEINYHAIAFSTAPPDPLVKVRDNDL